MKYFLIGVLLLFSFYSLNSFCQKNKENKVSGTGIIANIPEGSDNFVIIPDGNTTVRYQPINLHDNFKKNNLKVRFKGVLGTIPNNVRMVGTPIRLKRIEIIK